jgi:tetratricopeptide (TPR) repeat protein
MDKKVKNPIREKAFFTFFMVLMLLSAYAGTGSTVEEPAAKNTTATAEQANAVSKEIQQTLTGLGYSGDVDIYLVQMVYGWDYMKWKNTLDQAKKDFQQKKITDDQAAQIERKVLQELSRAIRKQFSPAANDSEYFYLSKVVKDKTAQSLGYSQLLYVLGNPIGLSIQVVDVLEPAVGYLPPGEEHAACLVELTGGKIVIADLTQEASSDSFIFRDQYGSTGKYWELRGKNNPLLIPRRIQVLDRNGLVADIYNALGNVYGKSGKDAEAVSFFSKAIELNPGIAKAYCSRGVELMKMGQVQKALSDLDKSIKLDPKDAEAYNNLGSIYIKMRQDAKAITYFDKAIEFKPIFSRAYKNRGAIYNRLGQNKEAIADLSKTVELDPKDDEAYLCLGAIYGQSDQQKEAITAFGKAIEINPKLSEAYNNRGITYSKMGKYTDAISDFIKATEIDPKFANAYNNRGLVYVQLKQYSQAIGNFSKALDIERNYLDAYLSRGAVYIELKQFSEAKSDFTRAIQINPKFAAAYFNRGLANMELKQKVEGKRDLEKAAELAPEMQGKVKAVLDKYK